MVGTGVSGELVTLLEGQSGLSSQPVAVRACGQAACFF